MNEKITFEAFYPHAPARVWKALTDPGELSKWLLPTDFRAETGAESVFKLGDKPVQATVLEATEAQLLKLLWDDGEAGSPSVVTWRLAPYDGGTRLTLEHAAAESEPYVLIEASMNWCAALYTRLPQLLFRNPPTPIVYVKEEPKAESPRRAGFRQEETVNA
jgi:uncharacterized protein YndB with AHSA1/START domain